MTATLYHTLPDGRRLAYCTFGDPTGYPIFYAHGGPGSRLEGEIFHAGAKKHGFRLIATDRPGLGRSDFQPDRTLLDYPQDLKSLAQGLHLARFGVMGWSGGGAPTSACTFAIPDRLDFAIVLAGYTNLAEFPQGLEMLPSQDRTAIRAGQISLLLMRFFFKLLQIYVNYAPQAFLNSIIRSANATDQALLEDPDVRRAFLLDQQEALRQGALGITTDAKMQYEDWGFRLSEIRSRLHVFQGTEDQFVPYAYAEHLAASVPDGVLHTLAGQGHFFPLDHQDQIFAVAKLELEHAPKPSYPLSG